MGLCAKERARERVAELAGQDLDLPTFWREAAHAVATAVPRCTSPCWFTLDPASLLVTSHYQAEILKIPPEWLAHEYFEDDFHKMADVARSERWASTRHQATGGDPSRSHAWRGVHAALWSRSGAARRPANPGRGRLGHADTVVMRWSSTHPYDLPASLRRMRTRAGRS